MQVVALSKTSPVVMAVPEKPLSCWQLLCKKIRSVWEAFWGFFARIFVFHHAVANTFCSRFVLGSMKGQCYKTVKDGGLDKKRLALFLNHLQMLGGKTGVAATKEKGVDVQYVVLSFEQLQKKVEMAGGAVCKGDEIIIQPPSNAAAKNDPKWQGLADSLRVFCKNNDSQKVSWKEREDGSFLLGKNAKAEKGTCLLRCRGPAGAFESKSFIASYLGAGLDICLFNWPGILDSKGTASESAYYAAAEAVYQTAIKEYRYDPSKVYASGFCLGGAVAANLYKDHYQEGLHLIMEHTFPSMFKMMRRLGKFESLAKIGVEALKSECGKGQDGFDIEEKLKQVPPKKGGSIAPLSRWTS